MRWFWANHAVHHSPNQFNLSAAYRLGWLGKITLTLVFFSPLAWLGFAPQIILLAFAIWNVTKSLWCDPDSLVQGHAAWHLLDAVSAYLLFRLWSSERTQ